MIFLWYNVFFSKLNCLFPCDTFSVPTGCSLGDGITPHHHHQLVIAFRSPHNFHIHHHHIDRHDNQMIITIIVIVIKVAARWVAGVRPPGCPQSIQPSRVIDIVIVIVNTIIIVIISYSSSPKTQLFQRPQKLHHHHHNAHWSSSWWRSSCLAQLKYCHRKNSLRMTSSFDSKWSISIFGANIDLVSLSITCELQYIWNVGSWSWRQSSWST